MSDSVAVGVHSYLRYECTAVFGIVTTCRPIYLSHNNTIITGALEYVIIWHAKQGNLVVYIYEMQIILNQVAKLKDGLDFRSEVTELEANPDTTSIAAGYGMLFTHIIFSYSDGAIKLWDIDKKKCNVTLNGHKSGISALRFNSNGYLLVSGSKDTSIIVWDIVNEAGLYKLKGHKNMITDCAFWESTNRLISSSKDSLIKIWDLETQHCIQTIVQRDEVWSLDINPIQTRLVTGAVDSVIRVWSLVAQEFPLLAKDPLSTEENKQEEQELTTYVKLIGTMERKSKERVACLRYNKEETMLACQAADDSVQIYKITTPEEQEKKSKKRRKAKRKEAGSETVPIIDTILPGDEFVHLTMLHTKTKIKSFSFSAKDQV